MMRAVVAMVWAHLLQTVRSRRALFALFGWPVVLTAVLSSALGGVFSGNDTLRVHVALVNLDTGPTGAAIAQFLGDGTGILVQPVATKDEALSDVATGSADVAVIIPADASRRVARGGKVPVEVDAPPAKTTLQTMVAGAIQGIGTVLPAMTQAAPAGGSMAARLQKVSFVPRYGGGAPLTASTYYAIGMTTLFMLTQAINRAEAMVRDRQSDRWQRLRAAPLPAVWRTAAWFIASYVVLLAQAVILWLASSLLFGARLGHPGLTLALVTAYAFALAGLATAIGHWLDSPETVDAFSTVGANILAALGGSFYPLYNFPHWLQVLGRLLPNGLMLQTWVQTALAPDVSALRHPVLVFAAIGLICILLATGRRALGRDSV